MFEEFGRDCPRCGAHLHGEGIRCTSCHKFLPRRMSKVRRVIENAAIGALLVAVAAALMAPDLVRDLVGKKPAQVAATVKVRPWKGPGKEPAARAWALPIEESLQTVCRNTISRYDDKKFVTTALTQFLPAATRDLRIPLTQPLLSLSPEEEKEAVAILSDDLKFMGECLRIGYEAIRPCEAFKADLAGPQASECMVPAVLRALAPAPFRMCAESAKMPRVRRACDLAADNAFRLAQKS